jgi:hypothetical protein
MSDSSESFGVFVGGFMLLVIILSAVVIAHILR